MGVFRKTAGVVALLGFLPSQARGGDVALIVHPANPLSDLSWASVIKIFRVEQQHWNSGGRIYLILQQFGTPEKEIVLRRVYRMKDAELKQFWLGKLFRGEIASFPRVAHSSADARRIVAQAPHALSFIDASTADRTVKVLRVDGRRPGEPGYVLANPVN